MQIRHIKTIIPAGNLPAKITAMAWSPNNQKLAVVGVDRIIYLFDETGEKKDRFTTKPADPKTNKNYHVCGLAFSPDSTKLAVAQTDNVIFVYKLGLEWGEKKTICNKFIQSSEVTCLTWPHEQNNSIVFGLFDGKVRVGNLKVNKSATLYQTDSPVISTASSPDGYAIITGHLDGSLNRFFFDDGISGASQGKFAICKTPPTALAWGESICAGGNDKTITFFDFDGNIIQEFDYSRDEEEQEYTIARFSPSHQTAVVGSFGRLHIYNYDSAEKKWNEAPMKIIENIYTISAMAWKPDGSRLTIGSLCGAVELFDCCLKRTRYKGKFEFTYVSPSQVIVKRLSTGSRIVLKSHYTYAITKVNIFQDQFLIANTANTLLMGDLTTCKLSEIPWSGCGNEKFYFENPKVCMVFNAGELSLIEYGINEILGSCRTEYMNPHLLSVRINERNVDCEIKKIAYLIDLQTIYVLDLISGIIVATINHDCRIDWLELSEKGNKLLFRDKRRQLYLYDVDKECCSTLLHFCSYVQWVPNSDVVVAQSRNNLCIWYSIDSPDRVTMFPIKGEIEDIERINGKTEVIVDEGVNTVSYTLDEGLIEFGTAIDDYDYERAISILEKLEITTETEAMWKTLGQITLKNRNLLIAERCYAALGDVAKVRYLHKLNDIAQSKKNEQHDGTDYYLVRAKLAVLDKQFKLAENIYLDQNRVEEAMQMYQEMHQWDKSIKVAEIKNHPELATLKKNYFRWLIDSGQEEKAGELKEEDGDYVGAVALYLKGGMPGRASYILKQQGLTSNMELTERVAAALFNSGLYEKAGELYEKLGNNERAFNAYRKGKAFRAAVEISRTAFPQEVINLEEQWGDYLVSIKQVESAINHYIEAGQSIKAMEAAINSKQWKKASGIVDSLELNDNTKKYCVILAEHFEEINDLSSAEKYYVQGGKPQKAVDMYTRANKWEMAHSLATSFMTPEAVNELYISQAREMEMKGKLKDAEKLYITVNQPDIAINMYKKNKQYDQMIRLVTAYHKDLLSETHLYLAKTLESEGNFKLAEHHYLEENDWKSVINMYCANNMYEEAYRIGKTYGGPNSAKQVAYLWARSLSPESAVKLLNKFGLLDAAIDFATDNGAFDFAFELGRFTDKDKISDIHFKHALYLEDEGKYDEAESKFIMAGKPREAILMYIHNENWDAAIRVAETYDSKSVPEVLIGQAKLTFEKKDYTKAESLLLRAQRPDLAIKFYKDVGMWEEAIKFTKEYLPNKLADINEEYNNFIINKGNSGVNNLLHTARVFEQQKNYSGAIDIYLKINESITKNKDILHNAWSKAVELAAKFVTQREIEVVNTVGTRLIQDRQYDQAAQLYISIRMFKEAIDAYIIGKMWNKAKEICSMAPSYKEYVENAYVSQLKNDGQAEELVSIDVSAGLNMYIKNGDWDKCLETSNGYGKEVLNKYLMLFCENLIKSHNYEKAIKYIIKYKVPNFKANYDIYLIIAKEILKSTNVSIETYSLLREMLYKLILMSENGALPPAFYTYMIIVHLITLKSYCSSKKDLQPFAAKQAISLLRYTNDIPVDYAFYEAGKMSKLCGMNSMAFVTWNRFLDITEAVDEGSPYLNENTDFQNTDVPFDVTLPTENMPEQEREAVRDWILQVSLDQKVNQEIDKRLCDECNAEIYSASLECFNCHTKYEPCIITGYPVLKNKIQCSSCKKSANRDDWNKFIMSEKACPWCGTSQNPIYSLK